MEIKYKFVNGEETSISVYGEFEKIILELDRNLYNNNQTETRRHISLSVFGEGKKVFTDTETGFEEQISNQVDKEMLYGAISKLKSEDRKMLNSLFLNDKPITQKEYAEKLGITSSTMRKRVERLKSKLARLVGSDE